MAIQTHAPVIWLPTPMRVFTDYTPGSATNQTLNATSDYWAPHFFCQDAITVDKCEIHLASVAVAGNITAQVHTLDTSGVPTTPVGSAVVVATGATGRKEFTGLAASCSADTIYCVKISVDASTDIAVRIRYGGYVSPSPYCWSENTSGSNVITGTDTGIIFGIGTSGGYVNYLNPLCIGASTGVGTTTISSSGTVHIGNKWVAVGKRRMWGIAFNASNGTAQSDLQVILSNAAGDTLAVGSIDGSQMRIAGNSYQSWVAFNSPYDTVDGTTYYLMVKALDTTGRVMNHWNYTVNDSLGCVAGTTTFKVTAATLGTYSETNTQVMAIWPIFSGSDDGAGAGGGGGVFRSSRIGPFNGF